MYITRELGTTPMITASLSTNAAPKPLQVVLPTFLCGSNSGDLSCKPRTTQASAHLTQLHNLIFGGLVALDVPPMGMMFFKSEMSNKEFGTASVQAIGTIVKAALPYMAPNSDLIELANLGEVEAQKNITLALIQKMVDSPDALPIIEACIKAYRDKQGSLQIQAELPQAELPREADDSTPQIDIIERQELAPVAKSNKKLWFGIIGGVLVAGTIGLIFFKSKKK